MSAMPLPASPLPVPGNVSPQGNSSNNAPNPDDNTVSPAFASVLQQKVQGNTSAGKTESKGASSSSESTPKSDTKPADTANATQESSAALAMVNGQYAETALQNLLPWLQGLQGSGAQSTETDAQAATIDALLSQTDATTQLNAPLVIMPALQTTPIVPTAAPAARKTAVKGVIDDLILSTSATIAGNDTAIDAAKLAANGDLLSSSDTNFTQSLTDSLNQPSPTQTARFDATLQAAKDHLNTQSGSRNGEPVRMNASLGSPQWNNELGDKIHLMSRQNESRAELILTPPQLGRIEISLDIKGDQASALFISANPEVRAALEGAMDRLRDVLAGNGIALNQSHVGAESSNNSSASEQGGKNNGQRLTDASDDLSTPATPAWTRHNNNMLDVFA
ncbi:MAG: flagellar hook-length control protein FliK [Rhodocyclaceae bacterium]|nr:flagellar hook-length control protein FliK [Rhodocyclaceae bacterium]